MVNNQSIKSEAGISSLTEAKNGGEGQQSIKIASYQITPLENLKQILERVNEQLGDYKNNPELAEASSDVRGKIKGLEAMKDKLEKKIKELEKKGNKKDDNDQNGPSGGVGAEVNNIIERLKAVKSKLDKSSGPKIDKAKAQLNWSINWLKTNGHKLSKLVLTKIGAAAEQAGKLGVAAVVGVAAFIYTVITSVPGFSLASTDLKNESTKLLASETNGEKQKQPKQQRRI